MSVSAEVQAFINEIEAQRNELGARAAKLAAKCVVQTRALEEREKTISDLRAELLKRDNEPPAGAW